MLSNQSVDISHAFGVECFDPERPTEADTHAVGGLNLASGVLFQERFKFAGVVHSVALERAYFADKHDLWLSFHIPFRDLRRRGVSVPWIPLIVKRLHARVMGRVEKPYCEQDADNFTAVLK
jgi:hypothetical protein